MRTYWRKNYSERLRAAPFVPISDFSPLFPQICARVEAQAAEAPRAVAGKAVPGRRDAASAKSVGSSAASQKKMRKWDDAPSQEELAKLDVAQPANAAATVRGDGNAARAPSLDDKTDYRELRDLDDGDANDPAAEKSPQGKLWGYFDALTGQKALTAEELKGPKEAMREHLIQKNVAADVAAVICDAVGETLVGRKTGPLRSVSQMVREATETAVARVLLPRAGEDLLGEIRAVARAPEGQPRRPYVLAFIGVNGVGKSTNLSKVCFWLLQNKLRVLIVAGDTFRSGAVEQLRTHVRNLSAGLASPTQLQLFERGYGKDAAAVAKDAISHARREGFDVVMIDTAGRMQGNAPLMAALAKLVYVNCPDKLIFVGEALVGNEAVDQLRKFNATLRDHAADAKAAARIDGILLTKFDTIDDKVGAALSMTFIANAPILFVGVGQTYTDLRKLNVRSVVASLLK